MRGSHQDLPQGHLCPLWRRGDCIVMPTLYGGDGRMGRPQEFGVFTTYQGRTEGPLMVVSVRKALQVCGSGGQEARVNCVGN